MTAVRKMLRKHDAVLPQRPIAAFYTARMHDMRWVQTDYSSVLAPTHENGFAWIAEVCCSVWNASLSEALRRLGYYARRVNAPLSVPRAP